MKNSQPLGVSSSVALEALGDFEAMRIRQRKEEKKAASGTLPQHRQKASQFRNRFRITQITQTLPIPSRSPLALRGTI
jgi:hypothetical protein